MTQGTIEELFEYRIANVVRRLLKEHEVNPQTGEELENLLLMKYRSELGTAILDEINTWMGFDDLLKQVQS